MPNYFSAVKSLILPDGREGEGARAGEGKGGVEEEIMGKWSLSKETSSTKS